MPSKKKDIPWPFRQLLLKSCLMAATMIISLYCGFTDSYAAFYVAVLIQAINNAYESYGLLKGYNKFITAWHTISFFGAVASAILAILFFAGAPLNGLGYVLGISAALSVPIFHYMIELFILWQSGKY